MATGFPVKANYATGDILTATNMNDLAGTLNSITSTTLSSQAGKNAVINGGFDIWQRGTSFTNPTTIPSAYSADRWMAYRGSGFTTGITSSRQSSGLTGFNYNIRVQRTAGNTSTVGIYLAQTFETVNSIPFAGQTVTLSFYARKGADYSNAGSTINAQVNTGTGTDENGPINGFTGNANIINQNATLTTSWQRFSYSGTLSSTATEMNILFTDIPVGTAGTNDYFEVTGVQLELGSTATTFSRAGGTIQGELAACQRYYWRSGGDQAYQAYGTGSAYSTTQTVFIIPFPVTMRDVPTTIDYNALGVKGNPSWTPIAITSANNFNGNSGSKYAMNLYTAVASGLTSGNYYSLVANNSTSAYLGFGAEL